MTNDQSFKQIFPSIQNQFHQTLQFHKSTTQYQRYSLSFTTKPIHQTQQTLQLRIVVDFPIGEQNKHSLSLSPDFASQVCEGVDRARIETVTDTPETLLTQSGKKYGQSKESGPPVTFVLRFITVAPHHLLRSSSSFSRFPPSSPILCNSVATLL